MTEYPATVTPIKYSVSCLPPDHPEHYHFELLVEWRGGDRWAVIDRLYCLSADGTWDYEMLPSERTDEWKATHRFDLDTALRLATEVAPKMTVGPKGREWTVATAMAEYEARRG